MTLQTLIIIILSFWAVILFGGFVFILILIGRHSVRDNPQNALILIKTGRHLNKPIKGKMIGKPTEKGSRYGYGKNEIFVPARYGENYISGKRLLFLSRLGQLIASPFDSDDTLSTDERNDLIYEICESHVGADVLRYMKGKSSGNIIIIAIIAFIIGAIAVFAFVRFQDVMEQNKTQQAQQSIQQQPQPNIIEVK